MNLLLVNDDGIESEGILSLAHTLSKKHNVTVVAPKFNQSAKSHSSTFSIIQYEDRGEREDIRYYAVEGTPADCTRFAVGYLNLQPDLVISGINDGLNVGYDTWLSGTIGAAREANFSHIPAIALSLYYKRSTAKEAPNYYFALEYIEKNIDMLYTLIKGKDVVLNINVPNDYIGEQICPHANSIYLRTYQGTPPTSHLWQNFEDESLVGTDIYYAERGYVTITPLQTNITNKELIEQWNKQK